MEYIKILQFSQVKHYINGQYYNFQWRINISFVHLESLKSSYQYEMYKSFLIVLTNYCNFQLGSIITWNRGIILREWVIVVQCQFNNLLVISWREQVNYHYQWDDDEIHFVVDQQAKLDFYSASLQKQQFVDRHVAPLGHIILILS